MYEHRGQRPLSPRAFRLRLAKHVAVAALVIAGSLAGGYGRQRVLRGAELSGRVSSRCRATGRNGANCIPGNRRRKALRRRLCPSQWKW